MKVLGIDFGGTGIKGAPIDTRTGALLAKRLRVLTPRPATPQAVARSVARLVRQLEWSGPIGCGVPAVVQAGTLRTAANIDASWIGVDAGQLFSDATGCATTVLNDADAAGIAEMRFGAGRDAAGLVIVLTLGTGIGTALFTGGHLVPNCELGHLEVNGRDAERWASDAVRIRKRMSWKKWAGRVDDYLHALQRYFWPDLMVIGGGASKKSARFLHRLTVPTPLVAAELRNEAGIVGAALAAAQATK